MKTLKLVVVLFFAVKVGFAQNQETQRHIPEGDDLKSYRYTGEILGHKIWGFITGHNLFRDFEWAEKYEIKGKAHVYKVISHHGGIAKDKTKKAAYKIYGVNSKGLPEDSLGGKEITYGDLNLSGGATVTEMDKPVQVEDKFFVSFYVADYAHNPNANDKDTMIVLTSKDGSRKGDDLKVYGRNVVRQHGTAEFNQWVDIATELEYASLKAYLALFPVIQFEDNSVEENYFSKGGVTLHPLALNTLSREVTLNFELSSPKAITIDLMDISGKLIESTQIGSFSQGMHAKKIKLESIKSGTYILALNADGIKLAQTFTFP